MEDISKANSSPKKNSKELLPAMYIRIMECAVFKIKDEIMNICSNLLSQYETSENRETLLREMFIACFAESHDRNLEPYVDKIGETFLELLYKHVWWRMRMPEIENFGKKFFFELCNTR